MRTEYIFPTLLIALDVCASVPYSVRGNLRMMIYWLAAATKNTDARLTRVEATVARLRGWASDCADHALLTRCRPVLVRLSHARAQCNNTCAKCAGENAVEGLERGRFYFTNGKVENAGWWADARRTGIKMTTINERLRRGWSAERALGVCDG